MEFSEDRVRSAYQAMCRAMRGGWAAMAAAMNTSKKSLENRVYENGGQSMYVQDAMLMQSLSGTTYFAEAVAAESGGVFIELPDIELIDRGEIQTIYMELVDEVGKLAHEWREATRDGKIDKKERARLEAIRQAICTKVTQMNHMTFKVFIECQEA
ncbi:YmfL family putative regulatory protein [Crenobacter sp. SG2303]|uniref:YmfL family putative regulatory protein n=1 Tax=Crenobacter oryzisoli TaxID=3056844 RepID=A0ABT7XP85_9NEIS|nr:YmfL family putative regulatory protein [Crenobacter sp. SG2303]MDN0075617.1 YmfL family putative regulatory protein [Crenobacter sp. SG2303]